MKNLIAQLEAQKDLSPEQATDAFSHIMQGDASKDDIAAFLLALKAKGETITETTAAASAMRAAMTPFETEHECIDVCGTGGDNHGTYNISTTVAFVLAGCGVKVVKHGNRSVSSKSGSSDVLGALGIALTDSHDLLRRMLDQTNLCFLAAPLFHPAMKHVAPVRAKLKTRTIFNMLGPLCNPARPSMQLMGVYDTGLVEPIAHVLQSLGVTSGMVVHGSDGLDEFTIAGESTLAQINNDIAKHTITPEDAGLSRWTLDDIKGGDAQYNAQALRNVLKGERGAYRDAALLNAAAGLVIADKVDDFESGVLLAADAIDSGRALEVLDQLVELS